MPTSPITASFCRALNLGNDPLLYRTTDNPAHERIRAFLLADLAVRKVASAALTNAGFTQYAKVLTCSSPICNEDDAHLASVMTDNICEEVAARSVVSGVSRDALVSAVSAAARAAYSACGDDPASSDAGLEAGAAVDFAIKAGADAGEIVQQSLSALYACADLPLPKSETDHVD
jgi:hypothetical protein